MRIKIVFLPKWIQDLYIRLINPVIDFFIKRNLNPNHFTTVGLILSMAAAYLFASSHLLFAGILMIIAGTFDIIDGKVARATNRVTKFGALYDSTLDRYAEVMIFFGLAYHFMRKSLENWEVGNPNLYLITAVAVSVALGGAIMTSYVRARAEGLGLECKVGLMQRPERIVFIAFGAIFTRFHEITLVVAIFLVAIFSNITAIQRVYHVWVTEKNKNKELIS